MVEPTIDIVVVNYKTYPLVQRFLDSLEEFQPSTPYNVFVVDNESDDEQASLILAEATLVQLETNVGYGQACNMGALLGDGDFIGFFNSDTMFNNNDCVDLCVNYLQEHSSTAVVGPLQYSSDGKVTHGGIFGTHKARHERLFGERAVQQCRDVKEAVTVSGSAYFTRRDIWQEMMTCPIYANMFPEALGAFPDFPHFWEETTYSYHVFAHGYNCVFLGEAEMIHEWHQSSPVGSQGKNYKIGQEGFRAFCDSHGVEHE